MYVLLFFYFNRCDYVCQDSSIYEIFIYKKFCGLCFRSRGIEPAWPKCPKFSSDCCTRSFFPAVERLDNKLRESTLANRLHAFTFASWAWLQSDSTYVLINIRRRNLFSRNIALRGRVHLYVDRHRHDSIFGMRGCELYVVRSEQYYKKRVMKFFHNSLRFVCRCRRHLFCLFLIGL